MEFMTREVFDTLIISVIIIGSALAAVRLYRDFTRPLPPEHDGAFIDQDTQPNVGTQHPAPAAQQGDDHDA
jgi:hypothetical protein